MLLITHFCKQGWKNKENKPDLPFALRCFWTTPVKGGGSWIYTVGYCLSLSCWHLQGAASGCERRQVSTWHFCECPTPVKKASWSALLENFQSWGREPPWQERLLVLSGGRNGIVYHYWTPKEHAWKMKRGDLLWHITKPPVTLTQSLALQAPMTCVWEDGHSDDH